MPKKKKIITENPPVLYSHSKMERLKRLMAEKNKEYKGTVLKFAKDEPIKEKIPFGVKKIDEFTGQGAIHGNFIIIYGSAGTGKTTLVLKQIAEAQKQGKICAYLDLEHGFNKDRALLFGVDLNSLVLVEGIESAEAAMDLVVKMCKEKAVDYIAIDSVQAMSPQQEMFTKKGKERSIADDEMAMLARKMGKFLRVSAAFVYNSKTAIVLIGQVRTEGIGSFVTRDGLTGGHGLKHWSQLTIYIRKAAKVEWPTEKIELDEDTDEGKIKLEKFIGFLSILKIEKTKTNSAPELSELRLPYYYASGFLNE